MQPYLWVANLELNPFDADRARDLAAAAAEVNNWTPAYRAAIEDNIAVRDHLESRMRMVAASKSLRRGWFDPLASSPLYDQYAESKTGRRSAWRTRLDSETAAIASCLADPAGSGVLVKGLVFGHVQSGKTSNFNGVACRAMDLGYRLVVILGGVKSALVNQTVGRIQDDIVEAIGVRAGLAGGIRAIDFPTLRNVRSCIALVNKAYGDGVQSCILCTLKNCNRIPALKKLLSDLDPKGRGLPILIIDDECDEGLVPAEDPSKSASAMMELFAYLGSLGIPVSYVGYTATPVANFLVRERFRNHSVFPREFIYVMDDPPEEDEYVGIYNFLD